MNPTFPTPGTDSHKLLTALLESPTATIWNPNSRLQLTAHSRASDLRRLGWEVNSLSMKRLSGGKRIYGYTLTNTTQILFGRENVYAVAV